MVSLWQNMKPCFIISDQFFNSYNIISLIGEQQSRWFVQLMAGKALLPDKDKMLFNIKSMRNDSKKIYNPSDRHTVETKWIKYMDDITKEFGAKPNLWKYFFTDNQLWRAVLFGPCLPYQYRLDGPHRWSGARDAIISVYDRILHPLQTKN